MSNRLSELRDLGNPAPPFPLLFGHCQIGEHRLGAGIHFAMQLSQPTLSIGLRPLHRYRVIALLAETGIHTEINLDCPGVLPDLGTLSDRASWHVFPSFIKDHLLTGGSRYHAAILYFTLQGFWNRTLAKRTLLGRPLQPNQVPALRVALFHHCSLHIEARLVFQRCTSQTPNFGLQEGRPFLKRDITSAFVHSDVGPHVAPCLLLGMRGLSVRDKGMGESLPSDPQAKVRHLEIGFLPRRLRKLTR